MLYSLQWLSMVNKCCTLDQHHSLLYNEYEQEMPQSHISHHIGTRHDEDESKDTNCPRHQEDNQIKAASSLFPSEMIAIFPSEMIAKLESTLNTEKKQGPNTKPPQTMGACMSNESTTAEPPS